MHLPKAHADREHGYCPRLVGLTEAALRDLTPTLSSASVPLHGHLFTNAALCRKFLFTGVDKGITGYTIRPITKSPVSNQALLGQMQHQPPCGFVSKRMVSTEDLPCLGFLQSQPHQT